MLWFLAIMPSCEVSQNNIVEYDNLKKEIIRKTANSFNLGKVKDCFSSIIDSRRSLDRIKNLNDLFQLLEERDALNNNNVSALICLGNLLGNENVINLVCGYKKLYIECENNLCFCGRDLAFGLPVVKFQRENAEDDLSSLDTAMRTVAKNIGEKWRVLASELKVRECYIDNIREKYPRDMYQQALAALKIWRKDNNDTASVESLKRALEARLCKISGIGAHLLTPVISID